MEEEDVCNILSSEHVFHSKRLDFALAHTILLR